MQAPVKPALLTKLSGSSRMYPGPCTSRSLKIDIVVPSWPFAAHLRTLYYRCKFLMEVMETGLIYRIVIFFSLNFSFLFFFLSLSLLSITFFSFFSLFLPLCFFLLFCIFLYLFLPLSALLILLIAFAYFSFVLPPDHFPLNLLPHRSPSLPLPPHPSLPFPHLCPDPHYLPSLISKSTTRIIISHCYLSPVSHYFSLLPQGPMRPAAL